MMIEESIEVAKLDWAAMIVRRIAEAKVVDRLLNVVFKDQLLPEGDFIVSKPQEPQKSHGK